MQRNLSDITYVKKDMAPEAPHRHLTCYSQVSSPGMDNVLKAACRPAVEHMPTGDEVPSSTRGKQMGCLIEVRCAAQVCIGSPSMLC